MICSVGEFDTTSEYISDDNVFKVVIRNSGGADATGFGGESYFPIFRVGEQKGTWGTYQHQGGSVTLNDTMTYKYDNKDWYIQDPNERFNNITYN